MGASVKNYLLFLGGLLVAMIVLQVLLNVGKKAPVVGGVVADAQKLANHGTLS